MNTTRYVHCALAMLLASTALARSEASDPKPETAQADLNSIASNAFLVLRDMPAIGLDKSVVGLERIIETQHRLALETGVSQRQLSLVLADAVAYAVITEIHRAELARFASNQDKTWKSVPFDKKTAVRLWRANMPDFAPLIRKAMQGKDTLTIYISEHSSEEDVLNGNMIDKAPLGPVSARILELNQNAMLPFCVRKDPSPDEQFVYALIKSQAFQDLAVIMALYEKGDLPEVPALFRSAIDGVLKQYPERRVDDGMKASSFAVWLTFMRYFPDGTSRSSMRPSEAYKVRQSLVLAPFMTDTRWLPEFTRKIMDLNAQSAHSANALP